MKKTQSNSSKSAAPRQNKEGTVTLLAEMPAIPHYDTFTINGRGEVCAVGSHSSLAELN